MCYGPHYVLVIRGGIEPELSPMCRSEKERNRLARKLHKESSDEDAILWLDIDNDGRPTVGSWPGKFFEPHFRLYRIKHKGKEYQIRATSKKGAEAAFERVNNKRGFHA